MLSRAGHASRFADLRGFLLVAVDVHLIPFLFGFIANHTFPKSQTTEMLKTWVVPGPLSVRYQPSMLWVAMDSLWVVAERKKVSDY